MNHQEQNQSWKVWNLINTTIHKSGLYVINFNCFNEPFAVWPRKGSYWDMHGLILETSIWPLAGSTRLMELYTIRAVKHLYGKQRCKTSDNRHSQMKTWTYKSDACSIPNQRLPISFHHENDLPSDLFINGTQSSNPTPWKRMALETRTPNNTHPRSRRTAPQESGDNSTEHGGMLKPKSETPKKKRPSHPYVDKTNHPTAPKHSPRTRSKPPAQRRLLTSALYPQTTMYPKSPTDPRAPFNHTEIPHTWLFKHGNLHNMAPTEHMDWLESDQHFWWSTRTESQAQRPKPNVQGSNGPTGPRLHGPRPQARSPKPFGPTGQKAKGPQNIGRSTFQEFENMKNVKSWWTDTGYKYSEYQLYWKFRMQSFEFSECFEWKFSFWIWQRIFLKFKKTNDQKNFCK